jgi:hypothetical protein
VADRGGGSRQNGGMSSLEWGSDGGSSGSGSSGGAQICKSSQSASTQLVSRADTAQPDLHHSGHQSSPFMVHLPIPRLEHLHTVITRQPRQLDPCENARQLRARRNLRQVLGSQLSNGHDSTLQPHPDKTGDSYRRTQPISHPATASRHNGNRASDLGPSGDLGPFTPAVNILSVVLSFAEQPRDRTRRRAAPQPTKPSGDDPSKPSDMSDD